MRPDDLALLRRFAASPEGRSLEAGAGWCGTMMDFAKDGLGKSVDEITAVDLGDVLFRMLPNEVICAPSESGAIVLELRAFFTFLKRERGLKNVDACLAVLDASAVRKLEKRLVDPANFGTAKLFFLSAGAIAPFASGQRSDAR